MELKPKNLYCKQRSKPEMTWFECLTEYIEEVTELIQRKCPEEELIDMQQEIAEAYGAGVSYLYGTRKHRDKALGEAYIAHPKGTALADEQVAICRNEASAQIRLHELLKDILEGLKLRKQINAQQLEMKKLDR